MLFPTAKLSAYIAEAVGEKISIQRANGITSVLEIPKSLVESKSTFVSIVPSADTKTFTASEGTDLYTITDEIGVTAMTNISLTFIDSKTALIRVDAGVAALKTENGGVYCLSEGGLHAARGCIDWVPVSKLYDSVYELVKSKYRLCNSLVPEYIYNLTFSIDMSYSENKREAVIKNPKLPLSSLRIAFPSYYDNSCGEFDFNVYDEWTFAPALKLNYLARNISNIRDIDDMSDDELEAYELEQAEALEAKAGRDYDDDDDEDDFYGYDEDEEEVEDDYFFDDYE